MTVKIYHWESLSQEEKLSLLRRAEADLGGLQQSVAEILAAVKAQGDRALLAYTAQYDGVDLSGLSLRVKDEELEEAERLLPPQLKEAIAFCVANVQSYHRQQAATLTDANTLTSAAFRPLFETRPGVRVGERFTPIASVGLYVPRGRGSFPSVMYMLAVPAAIAGVGRIAAATPPGPGGRIDPATLYTARLCGVGELYRVGGAQGIAALAYGTQSIPRVDKICGPGSLAVSTAQRLLQATVDIGLPAGPSEALILADESADPVRAALDLMIEAEHGSDSSAYLVTPSSALAEEVVGLLPQLLARLEPVRAGYVRDVLAGFGGVVITPSMQEAVEFVNAYAPEHVQIACRDPLALLPRLRHAGEILLGQEAPFSLANYAVGANHVLPTGGAARTHSPLSVRDFLKSSTIIQVTPQGFQALQDPALSLAEYEGFSAHALALRAREEIQPAD